MSNKYIANLHTRLHRLTVPEPLLLKNTTEESDSRYAIQTWDLKPRVQELYVCALYVHSHDYTYSVYTLCRGHMAKYACKIRCVSMVPYTNSRIVTESPTKGLQA